MDASVENMTESELRAERVEIIAGRERNSFTWGDFNRLAAINSELIRRAFRPEPPHHSHKFRSDEFVSSFAA